MHRRSTISALFCLKAVTHSSTLGNPDRPLSGARGQRAQAEMRLGGRTSLQYQWDNDNPDVAAGGDHGLDLKLRWEWND